MMRWRWFLLLVLLMLWPSTAWAVAGLTLGVIGGFLATYGGTILTVASLTTSIVLAFVGPRGPGVEGPRLGDTRIQTSSFGGSIPHAFGRVRMAGNVIWVKGNQLDEVRRSEDAGGKGGGGGDITTYNYFITCAIKFAEADPEATAFTRIWCAKKLVYDRTGASITTSKYPNAEFRFYTGTQTQDPDPAIEDEKGVGLTPAFRGSIYMVVENFPLADFGNFLQDFEAEIQFNTPVTTSTVALAPMNNFAPRDIEVDRNTYAMFIVRRTATLGADNSAQIQRFDLATNTLTASTPQDHGAGEHGIGSGGLRPRIILPGPDGKVFVWAQENPPGTGKWLAELNPFTLQVLKAVDFTDAPISQVGNFNENAAITWTRDSFNGPLETFSLITYNGDGGASPDTDNNDWYVIQRRLIRDGDTESGITNIHFDNVRDTNGSLDLSSACVDKDGDVWLVGRHTGDNVNTFGNRATMWRLQVIQNVADDGDDFDSFFTPTVSEFDLLELESRLNDPGLIVYDRDTHSLVIFGNADGTDADFRIVRYDIETGTILTTVVIDAGDPDGPAIPDSDFSTVAASERQARGDSQQGFVQGKFVYAQKTAGPLAGPGVRTWCEIDVDDLSIRRFEGPAAAGTLSKTYWHQDSDSMYAFSEQGENEDVNRYNRFSVTPVPDDLNQVLDVVLGEVRFDVATEAEYDAGVLAAKVNGYIVSTQSSGRDSLEPLLFAFPTDVVESDGKLKFVTRGGGSVRTIPEDDLAAGPGKPADELVSTTRIQEVELPEKVDVRFLDVERDYQENAEQAERHRYPNPTQEAGNHLAQNLPIVMTSTQAQAAAEAQLFDAWAARLGYEFTYGTKHMDLDPTDVVTLEIEKTGDVITKLLETELKEAWVTNARGGVYESSVFSVNDLSFPTSFFTSNVVGLPGPTEPFLLDIPFLRDRDGTDQQASGVYVGFGAQLDGWQGAIISKSERGATGPFVTFETAAAGDKHVWGYTTHALAAVADQKVPIGADEGTTYGDKLGVLDYVDEDTITVQVVEGTSRLQNTDEAGILNGRNAFVLVNQEDDSLCSEVSQFQEFTDNGDGTVTLKKLLRGVRGSEEASEEAGFPAGTLVVFLDRQATQRQSLSLEDEYLFPRLYRAQSLGQPFDTAVIRSLTLRARDLLPLPVNPVLVDVPAGASRTGNVNVSWQRRTRIGGNQDFGDGVVEPPLSEDDEAYEVDLLDTVGAVSTTKAATSDSAGVTFSAAERTTAGYAAADPFDVEIYQMTTIEGVSVRGMRRKVTV